MIATNIEDRQALVDHVRRSGGWFGRRGQSVELAGQLLTTVSDPDFPGAILPRITDGHFVYYVVADSDAQWRRLAPLAVAAVGKTLSNFVGLPVELRSDDPFENILREAGLLAGRVDPGDALSIRKRVAESLVSLVDGVSRAAKIPQPSLRTTASLLRDFDFALALKDRPAAEDVMSRLRADLRLEGLNHLFLEIETCASTEAWQELWDGNFFEDAARAFRPPRVTRALLRATYWTQLEPVVTAGDTVRAIEVMTEAILPRWGDLPSARPDDPSFDVQIPLLLAAGVAGNPAPRTRTDAGVVTWPASQQAFVSRLESDGVLTWGDHPEVAIAAVAEPRDDLRSSLIAAALASDTRSMAEVMERLRALPSTERDVILDHPLAAKAWELVAGENPARGIEGWIDWATKLPELDLMQARTWAREAITLAPVERVLDSSDAVSAFSTALLHAASLAESNTTSVLPLVLDWLSRDPEWPRRDLLQLYRNLVDILLLAQETNNLLVAGVGRLVSAVLAVGLGRADYRALCRDVGDWVAGVASLNTVDALVDLGELTVAHPPGDAGARSGLWASIVSAVQPFARRLDGLQIAVIKDLDAIISAGALTAGIPTPEAGDGERAIVPELRGRVAVYTLVESVARRVQEAIKVVAPNVRVDYATDKVGSDRLLALSREADVFAIDWSRAKHAATDFIRANRGGRGVLFTTGSGSSSIAREVLEALSGAAGAHGGLAA